MCQRGRKSGAQTRKSYLRLPRRRRRPERAPRGSEGARRDDDGEQRGRWRRGLPCRCWSARGGGRGATAHRLSGLRYQDRSCARVGSCYRESWRPHVQRWSCMPGGCFRTRKGRGEISDADGGARGPAGRPRTPSSRPSPTRSSPGRRRSASWVPTLRAAVSAVQCRLRAAHCAAPRCVKRCAREAISRRQAEWRSLAPSPNPTHRSGGHTRSRRYTHTLTRRRALHCIAASLRLSCGNSGASVAGEETSHAGPKYSGGAKKLESLPCCARAVHRSTPPGATGHCTASAIARPSRTRPPSVRAHPPTRRPAARPLRTPAQKIWGRTSGQ